MNCDGFVKLPPISTSGWFKGVDDWLGNCTKGDISGVLTLSMVGVTEPAGEG